MSTITLYGIPNCDSIKKARNFLESRNIDYGFHDYKKQGIAENKLKRWCKIFGYENVLNRRGTTWRKLSDDVKDAMNENQALKLMQEQPSIIKRPILEYGDKVLLGFDQSEYESLL